MAFILDSVSPHCRMNGIVGSFKCYIVIKLRLDCARCLTVDPVDRVASICPSSRCTPPTPNHSPNKKVSSDPFELN